MTVPPLPAGRRRAVVVMAWLVVLVLAFGAVLFGSLAASGSVDGTSGVLAAGIAAAAVVAALSAVSVQRPHSTSPWLAAVPVPAAVAVAVLTFVALVVATVTIDGASPALLLVALMFGVALVVVAAANRTARRRIAAAEQLPTS
ncbi:hypothetical protein [Cellulomonas sp.]|uniref:hypothetical protein n=1 Tax=Cellulomonas sp. TaxID=40001 RepID=UPI0025881022|nr:hypothetical protein [Cellulomonas sp.]MCR6688923.1 hypothetical protein [Cellulomonas sp.]